MNQKKIRVRFAPSPTGLRSALFNSLWIAMTGQVHGPDLGKVLPILGKKVALERIDRVIERYHLSAG